MTGARLSSSVSLSSTPGLENRHSIGICRAVLVLARPREDKLMLAVSTKHQDLTHDAVDAPVHIARRPVVSAIVAVRNEERHIESVVHSLLQQDVPAFDLELIIVDGDSCDATRDIVSHVASADSRVKLITNKHRKTPYAFNLGLDSARGEYVCILGAHTIYAKNYIAA